jgi:hypothetical protein
VIVPLPLALVLPPEGGSGLQQAPARDTRAPVPSTGGAIAGLVTTDVPAGTGRLNLPVFGASGAWPMPPVVVDGMRFRVDGIAPGRYRMQSVVQGVEDAVATFTDTPGVLTGTVTDAAGTPVPELYVVAFSVDRATWFSGSRRVAAVRPREGHYTISNLPPGEYRVAVADLDQNEWFDPSVLERLMTIATPVTIAGVERKTADIVVK